MPPRAKYTREEITEIALGIVAESGVESLNARSLAEAMGGIDTPYLYSVQKYGGA